jgi:CMP-N-acetylneuraminic acid synthetase
MVVDRVLVSTEDNEITELALQLDAATPRPRPFELAGDGSRTIDLVKNLVEEGVLNSADCLLLLQPTTPLRTLADLNAACDLLERNWEKVDAVVSVCAVDGPHPYKAQVIHEGRLEALMGQDATVPRQSLPAVFLPNGALYLAKISALLNQNTFIPEKTMPWVMPALSSINLDGPLDMLLLETVVGRGLASEALIDSSG